MKIQITEKGLELILTLIVLSSEEVSNDKPSLEKSTLLTVAVWALNTVLSPFLQNQT